MRPFDLYQTLKEARPIMKYLALLLTISCSSTGPAPDTRAEDSSVSAASTNPPTHSPPTSTQTPSPTSIKPINALPGTTESPKPTPTLSPDSSTTTPLDGGITPEVDSGMLPINLDSGIATPTEPPIRCDNEDVLCSSGECVDVLEDENHCGVCGNVCATGAQCRPVRAPEFPFVTGECFCPGGEGATACGGACTGLLGDPQNCGACGNVCTDEGGKNGVCRGGVCQ